MSFKGVLNVDAGGYIKLLKDAYLRVFRILSSSFWLLHSVMYS